MTTVDSTGPTTYERIWDEYARRWDEVDKPGSPVHLGDEWGSARESQFLLDEFLRPWLGPTKRALEIGPGGGKYTVMVAPLVGELLALDVSQEMLDLTERRVAEAKLKNVTCIKGNGLDLSPCEDESLDAVYSFDVFVHLSPIDTFAYLREMKRVLRRGGIGALTLANILSEGGFRKFVSEVDQHRAGRRGGEQFGYLTPTIASRFLFTQGFSVVAFNDEFNLRDFAVAFRKDED